MKAFWTLLADKLSRVQAMSGALQNGSRDCARRYINTARSARAPSLPGLARWSERRMTRSTHPGLCVLASFAVLAAASDQRAIAGLVLEGIRENDSLQDRLLLRVHPGRRRVLVCECCVTGEMGVLQNVRRHVRDARESEETGPLMLMPGSYARGYRVV